MSRPAVLLAVLALLAAPAAVRAQNTPFGPLPPAAPSPTPTPEPPPRPGDGDIGRTGYLLIALGVVVVFGALGLWITRDARRALTQDERRALERSPDERPHRKGRQAKRKARARTRAQRAARRRNR